MSASLTNISVFPLGLPAVNAVSLIMPSPFIWFIILNISPATHTIPSLNIPPRNGDFIRRTPRNHLSFCEDSLCTHPNCNGCPGEQRGGNGHASE